MAGTDDDLQYHAVFVKDGQLGICSHRELEELLSLLVEEQPSDWKIVFGYHHREIPPLIDPAPETLKKFQSLFSPGLPDGQDVEKSGEENV